MICVKCNSNQISGPVYVSPEAGWGRYKYREALRYTCKNCGYHWDTETAEQRRNAEVPK